jgi:hypothetical protein
MNDPNVTWNTPTGKEDAFIAYLNAAGFSAEPDTEEQLMRRHIMESREAE